MNQRTPIPWLSERRRVVVEEHRVLAVEADLAQPVGDLAADRPPRGQVVGRVDLAHRYLRLRGAVEVRASCHDQAVPKGKPLPLEDVLAELSARVEKSTA